MTSIAKSRFLPAILLALAPQARSFGFELVPEPDVGDGSVCSISSLFQMPRVLRAQEDGGDGPEGGGGGGSGAPGATGATGSTGGNEPETPKSLSQDEVGRLLAAERRKIESKYKDYDTVKAAAGRVPDFERQLEDMKNQLEDAGKSADQRERNAETRAAKLRERELEAAKTRIAELESSVAKSSQTIRGERLERLFGGALDDARVLQRARGKAISALIADSEIELDDSGRITRLVYEGTEFSSPKEAAVAFLKANDFYASAGAPPPGGGHRVPNSGGGGVQPGDKTPANLIGAGLKQRAAK